MGEILRRQMIWLVAEYIHLSYWVVILEDAVKISIFNTIKFILNVTV